MNKWDERFMAVAEVVAGWSKDPSTKCGAVITDGKRIVSLGFNGFPADTNDNMELYNNRPAKYARVLHAEINALLFANRDLTGCTCYVYPMPPCSQCAAALIQAGIARVVSYNPTPEQRERWGDSYSHSMQLFDEARVRVYLEEPKTREAVNE